MNETDSFTRTGAERLACTIRYYWAARGHDVRVVTHPIEGQENMFGVKSSLVNGKPPTAGLAAFNARRRTIVAQLDHPDGKVQVPRAIGVYRL